MEASQRSRSLGDVRPSRALRELALAPAVNQGSLMIWGRARSLREQAKLANGVVQTLEM